MRFCLCSPGSRSDSSTGSSIGSSLRTTGAPPTIPSPRRGSRLASAVITACLVLAPVAMARAGTLDVGNVLAFSSGSTSGDPTGTWTLDDKSFTYLDESGFVMTGAGGAELVRIVDSPAGHYHSFSLESLGGLAPGATYTIGYRVNVLAPSPYRLETVALDGVHLRDKVEVYKDVFSTYDLFASASGSHGGGDLAALYSLNGIPDGPVPLATLPTEVWVRDTIVLDGTGLLESVANTFTQAVPEIDPASTAPGLAIVLVGMACLERRRRLPVAA